MSAIAKLELCAFHFIIIFVSYSCLITNQFEAIGWFEFLLHTLSNVFAQDKEFMNVERECVFDLNINFDASTSYTSLFRYKQQRRNAVQVKFYF